ncbi:MAG: hypothetical protein ICV77_13115 [Cyanobacteria bacterium Co-bin8]|nr:hypothetical protein [Cyanobacteria bacterium Co-bin8]
MNIKLALSPAVAAGLAILGILGVAVAPQARSLIVASGDRPLTLAAETRLDVTGETAELQNHELSLGPVSVQVSYQAVERPSDQENNLQLEIFYNGTPYVTTAATTYYFGSVELIDLDNNGVPEIVLGAFTGGAHCCLAYTTYTWDGSGFQAIPFAPLDGGGGEFRDLNQDGQIEFITLDNAFFYTFGSYAGSFPPNVILSFQNGQYVDTTPQFRDYLRSTAWRMYTVYQEQADTPPLNGLLAGYVAQKIRLGEYQEGWNFMLAHYDRANDWGLVNYDSEGNVASEFKDFPAALRSFLTRLGYLDEQGNPQPQVNRSPAADPQLSGSLSD